MSDVTERRFHRPAMLPPDAADSIVGDIDPGLRSEAAHTAAAAIVHRGREGSDDDALVQRLVRLVDTEGLDTVAALWADSPPGTLPGALWRLYALREWTRRDPHTIAERYRLGVERAEVAGAVAGVAQWPGPEEIRTTADAVLSGVFRGDLDVALERAGAFCRVLATGAALDADVLAPEADARATRVTRDAGALLGTAEDLEHAAGLWRAGRLD